MSDLETTINFLQEDKTMTVFTSQRKWLNKLLKYANEKDSNVIITHKNTDGSAMFEIPVSWLKISPPRKHKMSDKRKKELAEQLAKARETRNNKINGKANHNDTQETEKVFTSKRHTKKQCRRCYSQIPRRLFLYSK